MSGSHRTESHLVIERPNGGRISQPFRNPRALYWLMFNLGPVLPADSTYWIEVGDGG